MFINVPADKKQTKFVDEFLIYPPFEKITKMGLEEQEAFFRKELNALQKEVLPRYDNLISPYTPR